MAGLWQKYTQLDEAQICVVVNIIKKYGPVNTCDDCPMVGSECDTCSVKDRNIKHVLIENYIPLVLNLAKKLSSERNRDELISVGLLALIEAVNRIPNLNDLTKFSAYVNRCVVLQMKKFIMTDGIIKLKINHVKGNEHLRTALRLRDNEVSVTTTPPLESQEIIDLVISNETEKIVLDCMIQGGYKNTEVAEMCHKSPGRISQIKSELIDKLTGALS